jgi:hypothetical protein
VEPARGAAEKLARIEIVLNSVCPAGIGLFRLGAPVCPSLDILVHWYQSGTCSLLMTDQEFLRALEHCELPENEFGHAAHVRAAYLYLREADFPGALERICRAIRNFAAHLGHPDRYHETVTVAYVALIQQHIGERGDSGGWTQFTRDNPELFQPGLLLKFYTQEQIDSEMARRIFLLPHLAPAKPVYNEL